MPSARPSRGQATWVRTDGEPGTNTLIERLERREAHIVGQVTWVRTDGEPGTKISKKKPRPLANTLIELLDRREASDLSVLRKRITEQRRLQTPRGLY